MEIAEFLFLDIDRLYYTHVHNITRFSFSFIKNIKFKNSKSNNTE